MPKPNDKPARAEENLCEQCEDLRRQLDRCTAHLQQQIAEREMAEKASRDREQRLRMLLEVTSDWVWEVDANGIYTYASPKVRELLGYEPNEVIGRRPFDFMPPDEARRISEAFQSIVQSQQPFERLKNVNVREDGRLVVLETSGVPVFDSEGRLVGYRGIDRDITALEQSEDAQRLSEQRLKAVLDNTTAVIYTKDIEGRYLLVNRRFEQLFGITRQEVVGKTDYDLFPREAADAFRANDLKVAQTGEPLEIEEKVPQEDGLHTYISVKFLLRDPDARPYGVCGISTDITQLKQAERELRRAHSELEERVAIRTAELAQANELLQAEIAAHERSEEDLRRERDFVSAVIETAGALVVVLDTEGRIVRFNRTCEQVTGYSCDEVKGKLLWMLITPEQTEGVKAVFQSLLAGQFSSKYENYWVAKDGSLRLITWANTALRRPDGSVEYIVGTGLDVTDRCRAEQGLRESEERFRELFEYAHDLIFTVDTATGLITTINNAVRDVLHYEPEELLSRPIRTFLSPSDVSSVEERLAAALRGAPTTVEAWCIRKDGTPVLLDFRMRAMGAAGQERTVHVIANDVTERRRESEAARKLSFVLQQRVRQETASLEEANRRLRHIQSQLIQAEKLAALGQLAAGVAHEINNPLSFVSNNLVVLRRDLQTVFDIYKLYQQVVSERDPARRLALQEEAQAKADRFNIDYIAANLERLFNRTIEGTERIRKIVRDMIDFARLGEAEWKEANLNKALETTISIISHDIKVKNIQLIRQFGSIPSIYCMPGRINQVFLNILLNAVQAVPEGGRITVTTSTYEQGIRIAISDNGIGIPRENLSRIFDPFFTTKPRGTGLGLSISYSIIAEHGGEIQVESTVGMGSTFTILLPFRKRREEA